MKKIVILGPESTGKSTLCHQLAGHFNTSWVPEYAREFLTRHGMDYTYEDLLLIAQRQVQLEDEYARKETADRLFVDTDQYVMKVWCEFVFGKCHQWILNRIAERKYDLYLLCGTDIPWAADPLREYPDLESRQVLFHMYKDLLANQRVPWVEINGGYNERLALAIDAINQLLK